MDDRFDRPTRSSVVADEKRKQRASMPDPAKVDKWVKDHPGAVGTLQVAGDIGAFACGHHQPTEAEQPNRKLRQRMGLRATRPSEGDIWRCAMEGCGQPIQASIATTPAQRTISDSVGPDRARAGA